MKKITFLVVLFLSATTFSQIVNIPDANFKNALLNHNPLIDTNKDGEIQITEAEAATEINVSGKNINDLTGINAFKNIKILRCSNNNLTNLELTIHYSLKLLSAPYNQLTSIKFGKLGLTNVFLQNNKLTSLNVAPLDALETLDASINKLTEVQLAFPVNHIPFKSLNLWDNELTSIDLSLLTELEDLQVSNNLLTSINTSNNKKLQKLIADTNQISSIDIKENSLLTEITLSNNQLSTIDLSNNALLKNLNLISNSFQNLDISTNKSLENLYLQNNQLTSLDISSHTDMRVLFINRNNLSSLNVSNGFNGVFQGFNAKNNPNLKCIQIDNLNILNNNSAVWNNGIKDPTASFNTDCTPKTYVPDDNFEQALIDLGHDSGELDDYVPTENISKLTDLDIKHKEINDLTGIEDFTALSYLDASSNKLSTINLSKNTELRELLLNENQLTSIDLRNNLKLWDLMIRNNNLTNLEIINNTSLKVLTAENNKITEINFGSNTSLNSIYIKNNDLTTLKNLDGLNSLSVLDATQNNLSSIDLTKNTNLTNLKLWSNQLSEIDLSQNTNLKVLSLSLNQFSNIDISNNQELTNFSIRGNSLNTIDVSQNTKLERLHIYDNKISYLDVSENIKLESLLIYNNQLTNLNLKNGKNSILTDFNATSNPNLTCIQVDNVVYSNSNWPRKDASASYSENCTTASTDDIAFNSFSIYPNPVHKDLLINTNETITRISIHNLIGKKVYEGKTKLLKTENLPNGIYLLTLQTQSGKTGAKKFIKN
ncbi:leucine-rich repeat domain-containing protein [Tenacibaculum sp. 190524A02b]|uniref:leucine-rich repeat domain-containing protein n=1 Tax=Tenacibaculum vairaonense TaxID=3137860 RepID=UPI0031FB703B